MHVPIRERRVSGQEAWHDTSPRRQRSLLLQAHPHNDFWGGLSNCLLRKLWEEERQTVNIQNLTLAQAPCQNRWGCLMWAVVSSHLKKDILALGKVQRRAT